jgi:hypothetical protein
MTILYLAAFVGGLLLAVRVMMFGVERPREEHPRGERTFRISPPVIVAFATVFGLFGYIMSRHWAVALGTVATFAVAAALGLLAAVISARLVRDWWKITPEHEVDDERYQLQGHLARVTKSIATDVEGEVAFDVGPTRHVLAARGLDDAAITEGAEVVIDRIEYGIAYVEAWAEVEKRL